MIGNWKMLASIFCTFKASIHALGLALQSCCSIHELLPVYPTWVENRFWSSENDCRGKIYLANLSKVKILKWNFETILDGHPHAIRFNYFGEVPECLTLKNNEEVYVRKLIVVIQIISLSFIDYRDVEDTKHPKHTYSSSPIQVIFHHPSHLRSPGHLQNLSSGRVPSNPKVTRLRSERSTFEMIWWLQKEPRQRSMRHESMNESTKKHTFHQRSSFSRLFFSRSKSSKSISSKLRDIRVAAATAKDAFFHPPGAA